LVLMAVFAFIGIFRRVLRIAFVLSVAGNLPARPYDTRAMMQGL